MKESKYYPADKQLYTSGTKGKEAFIKFFTTAVQPEIFAYAKNKANVLRSSVTEDDITSFDWTSLIKQASLQMPLTMAVVQTTVSHAK